MSECPNLVIGWHDIPASLYHADPCPTPSLSASVAKLVNLCPLKAYLAHPRLSPIPVEDSESAKMDFGSLAHKLTLGKGADVEVIDEKDWRKDAAKAARDSARKMGKIPALTEDFKEASALQKGFMREIERLGIATDFAAAKKEHTSIWRSNQSYLRCMIDAVMIDLGVAVATIYDIKTTKAADPDSCTRRIGENDYDLQAVFQREAVLAQHPELRGRIKHFYLFVETDFPYLVTPIELSDSFWEVGRMKFNRALQRWTECMASGKWPGYTTGIFVAEPRPWDIRSEEEKNV